MALVDGQRGEYGEDRPVEDVVQWARSSSSRVCQSDMTIPAASSAEATSVGEDPALPPDQFMGAAGDGQKLLGGLSPSGDRVRSPAATWSSRPATLTWKNSSSPSEKMARNFTRSRSGIRSSDGQLQQAGPEVQPGQLAVEEAVVGGGR